MSNGSNPDGAFLHFAQDTHRSGNAVHLAPNRAYAPRPDLEAHQPRHGANQNRSIRLWQERLDGKLFRHTLEGILDGLTSHQPEKLGTTDPNRSLTILGNRVHGDRLHAHFRIANGDHRLSPHLEETAVCSNPYAAFAVLEYGANEIVGQSIGVRVGAKCPVAITNQPSPFGADPECVIVSPGKAKHAVRMEGRRVGLGEERKTRAIEAKQSPRGAHP